MSESEVRRSSQRMATKLTDAMTALLEAYEYAEDVASNRWEFAVNILQLKELGCNPTDLRWLVRRGYVKHAREVTLACDDGRQFRPTGDLSFSKRTCFVLTDRGADAARGVVDQCLPDVAGAPSRREAARETHNDQRVAHSLPIWDSEARELRIDGQAVKRFKWRAANQEVLLAAFQEEGWPARIDDPLPPRPDQDAKRRLSDTIKCLNTKQICELVRFHGDGTGEGVTWERVEPNGEPKPAG